MSRATTASLTHREAELLGQTVVVISGSAGIGLETARRARVEGAVMGSLVFALAIASLMLQTTGAAAQTRPRVGSTSAELSSALEATTALVAPAVVELFTTSYTPANGLVPRTTDLVTTERASGSGVIVDPEGFLVTNAHVVRGAQRLRVEIPVPITD